MAATNLTLDMSQFERWCQDRGRDMAQLDFRPAFRQVGMALAASAKRNFDNGMSPDGQPWLPLKHARLRGKGDGKPLRDRGLLMVSLVGRGQHHVENITAVSLEWGTNLEYARLHQYGGVIRPKSAKALAIPLTVDALRVDSPRNFPRELFVWQSAAGKGFLAETQSKGRRSRLVLHYVFATQVTVPARPFLGINAELSEEIGNIFREFFERKLGGGK